MTPQEFKKRLDQMHEVIIRGLAYYAVWKRLALHDPDKVPWTLSQQNEFLGRYRGFFTSVANALLDGSLLQFAKLFDKDPQTASLSVLLNEAKKDASLVPSCKASEIDSVIAEFQKIQSALDFLRKKRNQQLAHIDANPDPLGTVMNTEVEDLAEKVKFAFNTLSVGHDGNVYVWDSLTARSDSDSTIVLSVVQRERDREIADGQAALEETRQ